MIVSFLLRLRQLRSQPIARRRLLKLGQYFSVFSLCLVLAVSCAGSSSDTAGGSSAGASDRVSIGTTLSARTLDPADSYEIFPGILLHF